MVNVPMVTLFFFLTLFVANALKLRGIVAVAKASREGEDGTPSLSPPVPSPPPGLPPSSPLPPPPFLPIKVPIIAFPLTEVMSPLCLTTSMLRLICVIWPTDCGEVGCEWGLRSGVKPYSLIGGGGIIGVVARSSGPPLVPFIPLTKPLSVVIK